MTTSVWKSPLSRFELSAEWERNDIESLKSTLPRWDLKAEWMEETDVKLSPRFLLLLESSSCRYCGEDVPVDLLRPDIQSLPQRSRPNTPSLKGERDWREADDNWPLEAAASARKSELSLLEAAPVLEREN